MCGCVPKNATGFTDGFFTIGSDSIFLKAMFCWVNFEVSKIPSFSSSH